MSFTGFGPLVSLGWGTTTAEALTQQAAEIAECFAQTRKLLQDSNSKCECDKTGSVCPTAIFHNNELEWSSKKKHKFSVKRRKSQFLGKDMATTIHEWQEAQLKLFHERQAAFDILSDHTKSVLGSLACLISVLICNIHLREMLIYPLARDHADNGTELYERALSNTEQLRVPLRRIRERLAKDWHDEQWVESFDDAERLWQDHWVWEQSELLPDVVTFLQKAEVPRFDDVVGGIQTPPEHHQPDPPATHDLNYGQQLVQMWKILTANFKATAFFQGIPKPRHEPDWNAADGFEKFPDLSQNHSFESFPVVPEAHHTPASPRMTNPPPPLQPARNTHVQLSEQELTSGHQRPLEKAPDAQSKEEREEMEKTQKGEQKDTQKAIEEAHKKEHGSKLMEKIAHIPSTVREMKDQATHIVEWLNSAKHTSDTESSFNKAQVNIALRNHGTHFEALGQDVTPLGNHYLLIHFDVQFLDPKEYRLEVRGCVEKQSLWTLDDIKNLAPDDIIRQPIVMECSGNGRSLMKPMFNHHVPWELQAFGCYVWTGIPLKALLKAVKPTDKAVDIVFTGFDSGVQEMHLRQYQRAVDIHDPIVDHIMLIWENNNVPLLREHGFPLRILTPGWYGDNNVKWLKSIEIIDHKCKGRHMVSYSYTKQHWDLDLAVPSQEIRPRAMLQPMGFPSFMERVRFLPAGTHTWLGKAWVGGGWYRSIMLVEVSLDDGKTWKKAELGARIGVFGWHRFYLTVDLEVGLYKIVVRATDSAGNSQKAELTDEDWNWHGMCDDVCQRYELVVADHFTLTT